MELIYRKITQIHQRHNTNRFRNSRIKTYNRLRCYYSDSHIHEVQNIEKGTGDWGLGTGDTGKLAYRIQTPTKFYSRSVS